LNRLALAKIKTRVLWPPLAGRPEKSLGRPGVTLGDFFPHLDDGLIVFVQKFKKRVGVLKGRFQVRIVNPFSAFNKGFFHSQGHGGVDIRARKIVRELFEGK
jgi:hypothetical protein